MTNGESVQATAGGDAVALCLPNVWTGPMRKLEAHVNRVAAIRQQNCRFGRCESTLSLRLGSFVVEKLAVIATVVA